MKTIAEPSSGFVLQSRTCIGLLAGAFLLASGFAPPASAATVLWKPDAGSADWANGDNWVGGTAPANNTADDIAVFNQASYAFQPNAGTRSINGIHIGDGTTVTAALTLSGTSLTIGNSGITKFANSGAAIISSPITLGAAQSWINNSSTALTLSGTVAKANFLLTLGGSGDGSITDVISSGGGLTKTGAGKWTLAAINTYTGNTTVSAGTLQIGNNNAGVAGLGSSSFIVASGATLVFNRNQTALTFGSQSISGAGDIHFTGQAIGYYRFNTSSTGTYTYTGKTVVNLDPRGNTNWFDNAIWLEKNNVLPNATELVMLSGNVILRNQETGNGITVAGLSGNTGTYLTTDRSASLIQRVTINAAAATSYTYAGVIGRDPGSYPSNPFTNNLSLTKNGTGTQVLTGANTYVGNTTVNAGVLALDFRATGAPQHNILNNDLGIAIGSASKLFLNGGAFRLTGKESTDNSQRMNGLEILNGSSVIELDNATGNNLLLTLGAITRSGTGTVNFILPTGTQGAANGITTTTGVDSTGILGIWATVNGTDWAAKSGDNIVAYTGYADVTRFSSGTGAAGPLPNNANANVRIINGGESGNIQLEGAGLTAINSLLHSATEGPATIGMTTGQTLRVRQGIVWLPGGVAALTIGNTANVGSLTAGTADNTAGQLIFNHQSASDLTVNAAITNNGSGAVSVTKNDTGTLILAGGNSYTGGTTINAGTVRLSGAGTLGSVNGAVQVNGGTLDLNGTALGVGSLNGVTAGIIENTGNTNATLTIGHGNATGVYNGIIRNGSGTGVLSLVKTGTNTITLTGNNTYTGLTTVSEGTLQIGNNEFVNIAANTAALSNTYLGSGNYSVATGAQLVFSRNIANGLAFNTQSISGGGDVIFTGGSTGYFSFRGPGATGILYTGTLSHTGKTIVNFDAAVGGTGGTTWFQRALWLEKDDVFSHGSVLDMQSGKVILRRQTGNGITMAGLMGNADTFITTDQLAADTQKVTVNVATGQTYTYAGVIGIDASGIAVNAPGTGSNLGSISFTKKGAGTQVLTGLNTYTGTTQVLGGNLQIGAGSIGQSGTGAVIVSTSLGESKAILSGTGTVKGAATVTDGVVRPGDAGGTAVGSLLFDSSLTFNPTSTATLAEFTILDDQISDQILVLGSVTLNGNTNFSVSLDDSYTPVEGHSWTLMDWAELNLNGFSLGENLRSGGYGGGNLFLQELDGYLWDISIINDAGYGSLNLSIVAVPEPSRLLLLLAGWCGLCLRRRR